MVKLKTMLTISVGLCIGLCCAARVKTRAKARARARAKESQNFVANNDIARTTHL